MLDPSLKNAILARARTTFREFEAAINIAREPAEVAYAAAEYSRSLLRVSADTMRALVGENAITTNRLDTGCELGLPPPDDQAARQRAGDESARQLGSLLAAADSLSSASSQDEIWLRLAEAAATLLEARSIAIRFLSSDGLPVELSLQNGVVDRHAGDEPSAGWLRPDSSREPQDRAASLEAGLSIPIVTAGAHVVAVITLRDRTDGACFSESDGALAEFLSHHAAVAVERVNLIDKLRRSEDRFRSLVQNASDLIAVATVDGILSYLSPSVQSILGYGAHELEGKDLFSLVHPEDREMVRMVYTREVAGDSSPARAEFRVRHLEGPWRTLDADITNRLDVASVAGMVINARDITERSKLEQRLRYAAFHDALTDLPSRPLFMERLQQALARTARHGGMVAVLFLDLDRFKAINDSFGHAAGDDLLVSVSRRLRGTLRPEDTVARFGGDEFAVIVESAESTHEAMVVADRIIEGFQVPQTLRSTEVMTGVSIGIAVSRSAQTSPVELIRQADLALYQAKLLGRGRAALFEPELDQRAVQRLQMEAELRSALDRGELRLHYQPEVRLHDGAIIGFEALLRWEHPERGLMLPSEFIALAEESGLIEPIGGWVLEEACRQAAKLRSFSDPTLNLRVGVNLSRRQVQHSGLLRQIAVVLETTRLDPSCLSLEIQQKVVMQESDVSLARLQGLRASGVRIVIDGFGGGSTALIDPQRIPFDSLKLDQSLMRGLKQKESRVAAVRRIIEFAHQVRAEVTANGVETGEEAAFLRSVHCDNAQGYFLFHPLGAGELERFFRDHSAAPGEASAGFRKLW